MIRANCDVVRSVPTAQLDLVIAACPGWQIDSVADHLARCAIGWPIFMTTPPGQKSQGQIMTEILALAPDNASGPAAVELCGQQFAILLDLIDQLDAKTPCVFLSGPGTVADWLWHIAAETWIHRADVELALGRDPLLKEEAGLDVLEWSAFYHLVVAKRQANQLPLTVSCNVVGTDESVVLGEGPIAASVSGSAADLALRLWDRSHGHVSGDLDALSSWGDVHVNSPLG